MGRGAAVADVASVAVEDAACGVGFTGDEDPLGSFLLESDFLFSFDEGRRNAAEETTVGWTVAVGGAAGAAEGAVDVVGEPGLIMGPAGWKKPAAKNRKEKC